jgi:hypothetical protein
LSHSLVSTGLDRKAGIVVVGGGRSTRIAGVIAVAFRTPVVAVAGFGAGAAIVWQHGATVG